MNSNKKISQGTCLFKDSTTKELWADMELAITNKMAQDFVSDCAIPTTHWYYNKIIVHKGCYADYEKGKVTLPPDAVITESDLLTEPIFARYNNLLKIKRANCIDEMTKNMDHFVYVAENCSAHSLSAADLYELIAKAECYEIFFGEINLSDMTEVEIVIDYLITQSNNSND